MGIVLKTGDKYPNIIVFILVYQMVNWFVYVLLSYRVPSYGSVHCLLRLSWSHLSGSSSSGVFAYSCKNLGTSKQPPAYDFVDLTSRTQDSHLSCNIQAGEMGLILRHLSPLVLPQCQFVSSATRLN